MPLKYRIEYDIVTRYQKKQHLLTAVQYFPLFIVVGILVFGLLWSPSKSEIYDLLLPGDPAITVDALQDLSYSLEQGEALPIALDDFCHAIMGAK